MVDLGEMMARHARQGRVEWIGLRPERRAPLVPVQEAEIDEAGLSGDHGRPGKRAVTLIQAEHLPVIAGLLGRPDVRPADLRRNIVVSGINLAALRKAQVRIGDAVVFVEGPCPPCSRMEETFGPGGYSAVRGHGGYYASVIAPGRIIHGAPVLRG
ncbi:MOSC domain-containing protein [Palleronia sp. LCG004]|uniref:MOSC domain-containing protein n=1 Tax=Palleronia sp. LCG004 TaxID=3079304 RepID=UPI002943F24A|nr:MOSC domain-containing protein [Palleronia sp. LCG004]WOI56874.1 MOSC domain-containing protein [Palleronia sp. LCG004]